MILALAIAAATNPTPDPSALLTVLGVVFGAVLTFAGVVVTVRASAKANARTVAVSSRSADVQGMTALVEALQKEVARLTARVERLEKDRTADREALAEARADLRSMTAQRDDAVGYARSLRAWGAAGAQGPPPPAPASVASLVT